MSEDNRLDKSSRLDKEESRLNKFLVRFAIGWAVYWALVAGAWVMWEVL